VHRLLSCCYVVVCCSFDSVSFVSTFVIIRFDLFVSFVLLLFVLRCCSFPTDCLYGLFVG
jgi:hypothetical protein